ncbi:hypothetical protein BJX68DRAFT_267231 [Aspergillus pseudodeflectus]|uniref:Uncharacterized protein n=1 Tax=Aspergillus pseudodeflectus TaxID=176178 RepID=A0ABR4KAU8_9EURO
MADAISKREENQEIPLFFLPNHWRDLDISPRRFLAHHDVYDCIFDENAPAEEQLNQLKSRYTILANNIAQFLEEEELLTVAGAGEWSRTMPGYWPKEFGSAHYYASTFGFNWAYLSLSDMKWTKAQKKQLVSRLDGYCVQEDLDSIISCLREDDRAWFPKCLVAAFLMKTAVDTFFRHPFWYIEPLPKGQEFFTGDAEWQGVSPQGVVLEELLAQFKQVNIQFARIWRALTTRLCNQKYYPADYEKTLRARRRARCQSLAKEILADKVFSYLMKPITDDQIQAREDFLAHYLAKISDIAANMHSQNPCLRFETLYDLEPRFTEASGTMEPEYHVDLPKGDTKFDGCRVLLLQYPHVVRDGYENGMDGETVTVRPALAVLDFTDVPKEHH